jgi:hypothetical protein
VAGIFGSINTKTVVMKHHAEDQEQWIKFTNVRDRVNRGVAGKSLGKYVSYGYVRAG